MGRQALRGTMDVKDVFDLTKDGIEKAKEEFAVWFREHREQSLREWTNHDAKLEKYERRTAEQLAKLETSTTRQLAKLEKRTELNFAKLETAQKNGLTRMAETVSSMDNYIRSKLNGSAKKPASATGPNIYAQDLKRARVETAGKIALAVAVALILAALKAL